MPSSSPLLSRRDCAANALEWNGFVEELRRQWRLLWRERIHDKVKAEEISTNDFQLLFVDRGMVIAATKCCKPIDFRGILEKYRALFEMKAMQEKPPPHVGGWRKFGRNIAASQRKIENRCSRIRHFDDGKAGKRKSQQLKKGGRGWLHFKTE